MSIPLCLLLVTMQYVEIVIASLGYIRSISIVKSRHLRPININTELTHRAIFVSKQATTWSTSSLFLPRATSPLLLSQALRTATVSLLTVFVSK